MLVNHDFHLLNKGISNYNDSSILPRHRWYHYKEGFSPNLVDAAISNIPYFNGQKDIVFDPFNGSGTVTLHAALNGYISKGFEVNPFSSFVSKVKQTDFDGERIDYLKKVIPKLIIKSQTANTSPLLKFSTFSEYTGKEKWLFNSAVLNSFESSKLFINRIKDSNIRNLLKLASLSSIMENCNAQKDGKCLRYKNNWDILNYSSETYTQSLLQNLNTYLEDVISQQILNKAEITTGDSRKLLRENSFKFKLCITSPPYANSFDYTDIYRPELFLGEFIKSPSQLLNLRSTTLRSHTNLSSKFDPRKSYGYVYDNMVNKMSEQKVSLWSPKIPSMIQSYFEDMELMLKKLRSCADKNAQLWLIVANSAYADVEVPTDLILAEIGGKANWYLKEIGVLRYLNKRGTKYSPNILKLRESVIIFSTESR